MDINLISTKYTVRILTEHDIDSVYSLCKENILYYKHCPPFVTKQSIKKDMYSLPPNKTMADKYYIGFFENEKIISVMDLIDACPTNDIAFIGFFMTDISLQNNGVGSAIISELCSYLSALNYSSVRLNWIKSNPQADHFWLKNNFIPIKELPSDSYGKIILAQKTLL